MAVTVEELRAVLRMEMKPFMRDLQQLNGVNVKSARQVERVWKNTNRRLDGVGRSMARSLVVPLASIAAAASVREVAHYADAWTEAGNKIAAAGQIAGRQGRSLEGINAIANATRSGISETTDLYAKLLRSTKTVAKSEQEVATATEIVNKAFKAGGAAASEQTAGILQLSQALGSGLLQGDELRSIRENAPLVAQAIAAEFKTTISGLKQLGADGELTTDRVFKAILAAQPQIEKAFGRTNQTIADGMTRVNNALTQYIGQTDSGLSATQRIVSGLNSLADNFDQTADVVLKFAAVIAGALVGRSLALMIAKLGLGASAIINFVKAARTMTGLAAAFGGLGAAAGPVGLLIGGAVVGSLALFSSTSAEASIAAKTYAEALAEVEAAANKVPAAIDGATAAIDEKTRNSLIGGLEEGKKQIEETKQAVLDLFDQLFRNVDRDTISPVQLQQLEDLRDRLKNGDTAAGEVEQALFKLATSNPDFQAVANAFSPLLTALANAIAATDLLRGKLAGVGSVPDDRDTRSSKDPYIVARNAGNDFVKEAQRKNSLTKEQLALETEIAKVKKAAGADAILTEKQIADLAAQNIAADKRRGAEGKKTKAPKKTADDRFDNDIQAIRDRTAALIEEQALVGKSYFEQERRRAALDLEQDALKQVREEARKKGDQDWQNAQLTPEQTKRIDEASEAYARQAEILRQVQEEQAKAEDAAMEFYDTFKSGMIDAITGATSFKDALVKILEKLADMVLNAAFDALLKPASGSDPGGAFGSIFSGIGKMLGFASGTPNTGGVRGQPVGIVHGQEAVIPLPSGGSVPVKIQAPVMPRLHAPANQNGSTIVFSPTIDARGASVEAVERLGQELQKVKRDLPAVVDNRMATARSRNFKGR